MKAIGDFFGQWQHVILVLGLAAIAGASAVFTPSDTWDKLGHGIARIVADPAGAIAAAATLGAVVAAFRGAWTRVPPALVLLLAFSLGTVGCGASALQTAAVGTTIALRAEEAVSTAVNDDLDRRMNACPAATSSDPADVIAAHNACVDHERADAQDVVTVLDALEIAIRGVGAGIATAVEIDAGQPLPAVILDAIRQVLALFDQGEAALRRRGIEVPPEIDMVVAALSALVGAS